MQNAVLVLSQSSKSVSVIQGPDLRELNGILSADGPKFIPAQSESIRLGSGEAYTRSRSSCCSRNHHLRAMLEAILAFISIIFHRILMVYTV